MFVNFSNHPSQNWSEEQLTAARAYGDINDIAFPVVDPYATHWQIQEDAQKLVDDIVSHSPKAVLCQGEFTLAYAVINLLKSRGITVLAACSDRATVEFVEDGVTKKTLVFKFASFREY